MHTIGIDIRPLLTPMRTGVGEYTVELLNALFKIDNVNNYFLFLNSFHDLSKKPFFWNQTNVHFVSTHYPNKLFNTATTLTHYPRLDKLIIKKFQKKLSHPFQNLDIFFSPNLNFVSLSSTVKHVLTIHDLSFKFFPFFFSKKQQLWHKLIYPKIQCQKARLIFTPSENTKKDLISYLHINPEKIKVIYPGISSYFEKELSDIKMAEVKKHYDLPNNFILFLGTIEPRKNILSLIKAFEIAQSFLPYPYQLIIAGGDGWKNKKIYEYLKCSFLKNHIKLIGYINPEDKPYLFKLASLFVYPSFYEGFGFPVLEAMASGVPTITSNRSSLPEITKNNAYLINPHYPSSIAEGIINIINNSHLKDRLIQKGLDQAKKFHWEKTAQEWLKIITEL